MCGRNPNQTCLVTFGSGKSVWCKHWKSLHKNQNTFHFCTFPQLTKILIIVCVSVFDNPLMGLIAFSDTSCSLYQAPFFWCATGGKVPREEVTQRPGPAFYSAPWREPDLLYRLSLALLSVNTSTHFFIFFFDLNFILQRP